MCKGWSDEALHSLREAIYHMGLQALSPEQEERFAIYASFLHDYNEKVNLTAITDPRETAIKHFADSLSIERLRVFSAQTKIIDVGSGAGFPGVPLLIRQPMLQVTLLDASEKRVEFLRQLLEVLNLKANAVHIRSEDAARQPNLRQSFDAVTMRAVASLNVSLEYALPFLKIGGAFYAQRGREAAAELPKAENALKILGGKVKRTDLFSLKDNRTTYGDRSLMEIVKERATQQCYPRKPKDIRERPL